MNWMQEIIRLFRSWWSVDQIRLAPSVGRLGTLRIGDRFVWQDHLYRVHSQLDCTVTESRCEVLWRLMEHGIQEEGLEEESHAVQLRVLASSSPEILLRGYLRFCNSTTQTGETLREEEIADQDITLLARDSYGTRETCLND